MSKLKFILPAVMLVGMFSVISCKKTTTNNIVSKDSVYYSAWAPMSTQLQVDQTTGDSTYVEDFNTPAITSAIVSRGAVLGYYGYPVSATDTLMFDEAEMTGFANMSIIPGAIEIVAGGDMTYTGASGYLFRYVVIPGNILATTFSGMTQQQLNKMTFSDIQKAISTSKEASGNTFTP